MPQKHIIKCPECGEAVEFFAEPIGPFCSQRCKLLDLGKWFNQEHCISEPLRPDHFEEFEGMEGGEELDRPN